MGPISANPASTEAREPARTHGTCFVARHLALAAVAVLLRFWWFVLDAAGSRFFFRVR